MSSELGSYIAGLLAGYDAVELAASEVSDTIKTQIGAFAAFQALRVMGIELPLGGDVNQLTITEAINRDVLGGQFDFKNLFDKEQVRADVRRIALAKAGELYGYDGGRGVAGLREKIISEVIAQVKEQTRAGAGDYVDFAPSLTAAQRVIDSSGVAQSNAPTSTSDKAEKSRARQAKYRASHTRKWVPR